MSLTGTYISDASPCYTSARSDRHAVRLPLAGGASRPTAPLDPHPGEPGGRLSA
jgi:hypothetical protein